MTPADVNPVDVNRDRIVTYDAELADRTRATGLSVLTPGASTSWGRISSWRCGHDRR